MNQQPDQYSSRYGQKRRKLKKPSGKRRYESERKRRSSLIDFRRGSGSRFWIRGPQNVGYPHRQCRNKTYYSDRKNVWGSDFQRDGRIQRKVTVSHEWHGEYEVSERDLSFNQEIENNNEQSRLTAQKVCEKPVDQRWSCPDNFTLTVSENNNRDRLCMTENKTVEQRPISDSYNLNDRFVVPIELSKPFSGYMKTERNNPPFITQNLYTLNDKNNPQLYSTWKSLPHNQDESSSHSVTGYQSTCQVEGPIQNHAENLHQTDQRKLFLHNERPQPQNSVGLSSLLAQPLTMPFVQFPSNRDFNNNLQNFTFPSQSVVGSQSQVYHQEPVGTPVTKSDHWLDEKLVKTEHTGNFQVDTHMFNFLTFPPPPPPNKELHNLLPDRSATMKEDITFKCFSPTEIQMDIGEANQVENRSTHDVTWPNSIKSGGSESFKRDVIKQREVVLPRLNSSFPGVKVQDVRRINRGNSENDNMKETLFSSGQQLNKLQHKGESVTEKEIMPNVSYLAIANKGKRKQASHLENSSIGLAKSKGGNLGQKAEQYASYHLHYFDKDVVQDSGNIHATDRQKANSHGLPYSSWKNYSHYERSCSDSRSFGRPYLRKYMKGLSKDDFTQSQIDRQRNWYPQLNQSLKAYSDEKPSCHEAYNCDWDYGDRKKRSLTKESFLIDPVKALTEKDDYLEKDRYRPLSTAVAEQLVKCEKSSSEVIKIKPSSGKTPSSGQPDMSENFLCTSLPIKFDKTCSNIADSKQDMGSCVKLNKSQSNTGVYKQSKVSDETKHRGSKEYNETLHPRTKSAQSIKSSLKREKNADLSSELLMNSEKKDQSLKEGVNTFSKVKGQIVKARSHNNSTQQVCSDFRSKKVVPVTNKKEFDSNSGLKDHNVSLDIEQLKTLNKLESTPSKYEKRAIFKERNISKDNSSPVSRNRVQHLKLKEKANVFVESTNELKSSTYLRRLRKRSKLLEENPKSFATPLGKTTNVQRLKKSDTKVFESRNIDDTKKCVFLQSLELQPKLKHKKEKTCDLYLGNELENIDSSEKSFDSSKKETRKLSVTLNNCSELVSDVGTIPLEKMKYSCKQGKKEKKGISPKKAHEFGTKKLTGGKYTCHRDSVTKPNKKVEVDHQSSKSKNLTDSGKQVLCTPTLKKIKHSKSQSSKTHKMKKPATSFGRSKELLTACRLARQDLFDRAIVASVMARDKDQPLAEKKETGERLASMNKSKLKKTTDFIMTNSFGNLKYQSKETRADVISNIDTSDDKCSMTKPELDKSVKKCISVANNVQSKLDNTQDSDELGIQMLKSLMETKLEKRQSNYNPERTSKSSHIAQCLHQPIVISTFKKCNKSSRVIRNAEEKLVGFSNTNNSQILVENEDLENLTRRNVIPEGDGKHNVNKLAIEIVSPITDVTNVSSDELIVSPIIDVTSVSSDELTPKFVIDEDRSDSETNIITTAKETKKLLVESVQGLATGFSENVIPENNVVYSSVKSATIDTSVTAVGSYKDTINKVQSLDLCQPAFLGKQEKSLDLPYTMSVCLKDNDESPYPLDGGDTIMAGKYSPTMEDFELYRLSQRQRLQEYQAERADTIERTPCSTFASSYPPCTLDAEYVGLNFCNHFDQTDEIKKGYDAAESVCYSSVLGPNGAETAMSNLNDSEEKFVAVPLPGFMANSNYMYECNENYYKIIYTNVDNHQNVSDDIDSLRRNTEAGYCEVFSSVMNSMGSEEVYDDSLSLECKQAAVEEMGRKSLENFIDGIRKDENTSLPVFLPVTRTHELSIGEILEAVSDREGSELLDSCGPHEIEREKNETRKNISTEFQSSRAQYRIARQRGGRYQKKISIQVPRVKSKRDNKQEKRLCDDAAIYLRNFDEGHRRLRRGKKMGFHGYGCNRSPKHGNDDIYNNNFKISKPNESQVKINYKNKTIDERSGQKDEDQGLADSMESRFGEVASCQLNDKNDEEKILERCKTELKTKDSSKDKSVEDANLGLDKQGGSDKFEKKLKNDKAKISKIQPIRIKGQSRCSLCEFESSDRTGITLHYIKKHGNWCIKCQRQFQSVEARRLHVQRNHDVQIYCGVCNVTLEQKSGLKRHLNSNFHKKNIKE